MAENSDKLGPDGLSDAERQAKWERVDEIVGDSRFSVVPLYAPQGRRVPKHGGCGVAVRIGDRVVVLTAGHVFDGFAREEGSRIAAAIDGAFLPLAGQVSRSESIGDRGDIADAAVIVLDEDESSSRLMPYALPWSLNRIPAPQPAGTPLLLYGYPHRDAERTEGNRVFPKRYLWETRVASLEAYAKFNTKLDEYVVGDMPLSQSVDAKGRIARSVKPAGVSGSGVWILDATPPRLYAIFTAIRGDYMFATPVIVHALLLRRSFPDLYEVLSA